jgi:predicted Zn finger-like uncharacterized protein
MNVSCPDCHSVFRVDPARIPGPGVRARCSVCGGIIAIQAGRNWAEDFPGTSAEATAASALASARVTPRAEAAVTAPRAPTPRSAPGVPAPTMPKAATPARGVPGVVSAAAPSPARVTPPFGAPRRPAPPPPPPPGITAAPPPPRAPSPATGEPAIASSQMPMVPRRETPPSASPAPRVGTPAGTPVVPIASAPRAATPTTGPAPGVRSPINPFLANDPNQKAKRLARALVSDMVAYHPNKREEGLRNGTLKQLFREEIKKSYEEYVEQIGKEIAETTTHFQDALNDVLAGGKKLF